MKNNQVVQGRKTRTKFGRLSTYNADFNIAKVALQNEPGAYDTLSRWQESLKWWTHSKNERRSCLW